MNNEIKSLIFDFVQVGVIVFMVLTGPIITFNPVLIFFQIVSIFILFIAAWEMRRTKYYRVPDTGKQSELVKTGIYTHIRNPMYVSELLFLGVLLINSFSILRLIAYGLFIINFIFKIHYEEALLNTHFREFEAYKKTSWRLIPFIY